jgi:hypothetical protein
LCPGGFCPRYDPVVPEWTGLVVLISAAVRVAATIVAARVRSSLLILFISFFAVMKPQGTTQQDGIISVYKPVHKEFPLKQLQVESGLPQADGFATGSNEQGDFLVVWSTRLRGGSIPAMFPADRKSCRSGYVH